MQNTLAFVFPGQGSQSLGMLTELAESYSVVGDTVEQANDALGQDLGELIANGPAEALGRTENTQPAMLTADIATWRVWLERGGEQPGSVAGHSLGEYSALVAAGAMGFADAVRVVRERGRLMQAAVPEGTGAMAAIIGLDDEGVRALCASVAGDQVCEPVNFNAPGQVVIAGDAQAIGRAVDAAKEAGAKRALPLPVSVPSHCSLMREAADQLSKLLADVEIQMPDRRLLHNASVAAAETADEVRSRLAEQLYSPVRWVETIESFAGDGVSTLIECGPGKVLVGLNKRIARGMTAMPLVSVATIDAALEAVSGS